MHSANVTEIRLSEDCFGSGEILIFDMVNIKLSELKKLTPTTVAKILVIFQVTLKFCQLFNLFV